MYYGATPMEAQLCAGQDVAVVGGANAAGEAAVFLASTARRVHMLVRGPGLAEKMSRYLIRRIEENPAIILRTRTQIVALDGNGKLERIRWRDDQSTRHLCGWRRPRRQVKRVASAVGEGSIAVTFVHQVLRP